MENILQYEYFKKKKLYCKNVLKKFIVGILWKNILLYQYFEKILYYSNTLKNKKKYIVNYQVLYIDPRPSRQSRDAPV